jgi:Nucleoside 2-deoxyribosyltransferase
MKKVFVSTSISSKVDKRSGQIEPEFRRFITQILKDLRREGISVFAAIEDEGWSISVEQPSTVGILKDLEQLAEADVLLAIMHDALSAGVQFEIGYAVARGKPVILAYESKMQMAYFNEGIANAALVTMVSYDSVKSLIYQLLRSYRQSERLQLPYVKGTPADVVR